ncbi:MAG TPA: hypothetical protein DCW43_04355 [Clostridiales bacterium]|nr:hypothetical protein [Clostridiales bacterium]
MELTHDVWNNGFTRWPMVYNLIRGKTMSLGTNISYLRKQKTMTQGGIHYMDIFMAIAGC